MNRKWILKKRLEDFGFDTSKHDFLFPHLAVYDTAASLPAMTIQPALKKWKTCPDANGDLVECKLHFNTSHELLSYSLATNVPGTTFF